MSNVCLGNLLPSSVLAYDNIDLIPNGYIPEVGTTARPRTRNAGGQVISSRETIRLLPADRLYAEFWYGVSSRITGTNLRDAGQGAFDALGFLGGGAGAVIGGALACTLTGDSERTISRWVFHVCDAESKLNREYILTQENIDSKTITLPDYIEGVLGVTKAPIEFVTPTTPLTSEQMAQAKAIPSDEVEARLGRRVAPDQLTDSDMRILLGLGDLNELENLGNSNGAIRGWPQTAEGQIQAEYTNYSYSDSSNLFVRIVRDSRKNLYRADNEFDRANGHCFWNGSTDDLTDKVIEFNLQETVDPNLEGPPLPPLKAGDKVYISYAAAIKPLFRHATENITNFFLFPDQSAYQLPPLDKVKGWNFKKFEFKVRKKESERCVLADIVHDDEILRQISSVQSDGFLSASEKAKRIAKLRSEIILTSIEGQRLVESKLEKAQRVPFIKGCYFADSRGILSLDLRGGTGQPSLIIARNDIRDQGWFDSLLQDLQSSAPGAFDENGEILLSSANDLLFDDFLFDISDHVNMALYDNEKYGYERRFANAIAACSSFVQDKNGTGVGIPNLDFVKNQTPGRDSYDLSSAKFTSVPMQGSATLSTCNVVFVYDFGFCTRGTIRADMLLRTPFFMNQLTTKSRIYVEKFQAQNPLTRDGGIFVGTRISSDEKYSVTTDPKNYYGCLVYPDSNNGTTNFRIFNNGTLEREFQTLKRSEPQSSGHSLPAIDSSLTEESIKYGGYDGILGDQPGYFKGIEITKDKAAILMGKDLFSSVKTDNLAFTVEESSGRLNVTGIPGRRMRKVTLRYTPSKKFVEQDERIIAFVFPGSKNVIDNIGIAYQGPHSERERVICVTTKYIPLENWFVDGEILKEMTVTAIEVDSVEEEFYQKYKVSTNAVSTCFNSRGDWLVFYEDENGGDGDLSKGGANADGSHLVGPFEDGAMPGLQDKSDKEISCLLSPDRGRTWYDFKGIVRTIVGDEVGNPVAVSDIIGNKVHLFYTLNNSLMHKIIQCNDFQYDDAFLAYKRPNSINAQTLVSYGLYHFSSFGIRMRESVSSVVVGNMDDNYIKSQILLNEEMKSLKRYDYRITISGDSANYTQGFPDVDFVSYRDSSGQLKVIFVSGGKIHCRGSSDEGFSWFEFIDDGMYIHKNSSIQELKPVYFLGYAVDTQLQKMYLTYQVDGMLFVRKFDAGASVTSTMQMKDILDPDVGSSKPVFVVGSLSPEVKTALKNKEEEIVFPYKDMDVFGGNYAISETPSLGYSTAGGLLRLFYKDASGNFRAFSYPETPILDITYGKP